VLAAAFFAAAAPSLCAEIAWTPSDGWEKNAPSISSGDTRFDEAVSLFMDGHHSGAARKFAAVAADAREPLRERARLFHAECLLAKNDYAAAFKTFEKFFEEYPNSPYAHRALEGELELATALLAGGKVRHLGLRIWTGYRFGEKVVDRILSHRPLSGHAQRAQLLLSRSYFRRGLYIESASAYRQYVELFPSVPSGDGVEEALVGVAQSLILDAQGPRYDPLPYHRAGSLAVNIQHQYPDSQSEAAGKIERAAVEKLGEHYFMLAKWYLKAGKTDAALLYLRKVADSYGETTWADRASAIIKTLTAETETDDES
jgi:outer membrane protein assembly factor BamD (BamD/ComL family)